MNPPTISTDSSSAATPLAHPLDEFYASVGQALPPMEQIDGEGMPQPYRQLLVHHHDMTPTLESFHGRDIHLQVLGRRQSNDEYYREVVLLLDGSNQPVEFGAIKINLGLFAPDTRQQILEERRPLGHILQEYAVKHSSQPKAFLRVASDRIINEALLLTGAHILYGRRNTLSDPEGRPLAEIVEILPPTTAP